MSEPMQHAIRVYYDGGCPICKREIGFYRRQSGADRIDWLNLVGADPEQLGPDLDYGSAMARLHVRRADGQLVSGARGFALMWQHLPRFRLLGHIAALPGIVHVLEIGYRVVLRLRTLWRKPEPAVCPLGSASPEPERQRADK